MTPNESYISICINNSLTKHNYSQLMLCCKVRDELNSEIESGEIKLKPSLSKRGRVSLKDVERVMSVMKIYRFSELIDTTRKMVTTETFDEHIERSRRMQVARDKRDRIKRGLFVDLDDKDSPVKYRAEHKKDLDNFFKSYDEHSYHVDNEGSWWDITHTEKSII